MKVAECTFSCPSAHLGGLVPDLGGLVPDLGGLVPDLGHLIGGLRGDIRTGSLRP